MNKSISFLLLILILPVLSADIISLNSGGSNVIVINPDTYIGGFFSDDNIAVCVPTTCVALGYECGTWSDGCSGTLNCGTCASGYTCESGTCVAEGEEGGGGGGGGGETISLTVSPEEIDMDLVINTNEEQTITVTNTGTSSVTISVGYTGLTNMVILENTSLTLDAGETKQFNVIFVASDETGIFTGYLVVGSELIPVSINVKTKLLLFDSNIVVLNADYKVSQGSDLKTKVTLLPMGEDQERADVTLNYVIKDYDGNIYLTQSETVLVEEQTSFKKNFDTGSLPLGQYIVGLELVYSEGIAPSSAHFEVVEKTFSDLLSDIIFILIIAILLIAIIIVILVFKRRKDREKEAPIQ